MRSAYFTPAFGVSSKRPRPSCSERTGATTSPVARSITAPDRSAGLCAGVSAWK